jgi:uncharacterized protein
MITIPSAIASLLRFRLGLIKSGPLTNREIEKLDTFLHSDGGLENAMDVSTLDGFLCAVLSGPNVIMPSEWMRWVWDKEEGEQVPEFASETQAQRILSLVMRYANDIAVTLTQAPQGYEPLFLERDVNGRIVPIVDEWCCGYMKGIALDPLAWQPLIEAQSDWFEVIHLYGTEGGWNKLKTLVDAHEDADARHQAFVAGSPPPSATSMRTSPHSKLSNTENAFRNYCATPYGRGHDDDSFHPDFDPRLPHS